MDMKREITPTSPLKREIKKIKQEKSRWPFINLVLAIIFGFVAGFLGNLVSQSWEVIDHDYSAGQEEEVLVIKDSSQSDHPDLIEHLVEQNRAATVSLYQGTQRLGTGLILTNDGWVVTLSAVSVQSNSSIITKDKKSYTPEKIISDSFSDFTFVKINAQNLSVAEFADPDGLKLGSELLAYYCSPTQKDVVSITHLVNSTYQAGELKTTQKYSANYLIDQSLSNDYLASPLLDLNGKIIGLYVQEDKVVPASIINNLLSQVIKEGSITHSTLGISYYDLAYSLDPEYDKGALVTQLNKISNLKINDIIISVEGQELDQNNDLTEVLERYSVGETIKMIVLRNQEEIEVEIIL